MEVRIITSRDLMNCPKSSLLPSHFRDDGTCRCDEREEAQRDIARAEAAARQARADLDAARERLRHT
jgi:hypothetical protein